MLSSSAASAAAIAALRCRQTSTRMFLGPLAGGRQRFERARTAAHREAAVEQVGRLLGAQLRRRGAEHHHDETPAVMAGGRHDVESGRTGEARLHAVGAGIAADAGRCGW